MSDATHADGLAFDAELGVLFACLTNDDSRRVALEEQGVRPAHLYQRDAAACLAVIERLHGEGRGVDSVTVASVFSGAERAHMRDLLFAVNDGPFVAGHVRDYCSAVLAAYGSRAARRLVAELDTILRAADGDGAPIEKLEALWVARMEEIRGAASGASGPALAVTTAAELRDVTDERPDWILAGYIARGAITDLVSKSKVGKSTLVRHILAAQLAGEPFLGQKTSHAGVLYLCEERPPTLRQGLERVGLLGSDDLHIVFRSDVSRRPWEQVVDLAVRHCRDVDAGLLVVDTLADFAGMEAEQENDASAALAVMRPLQEAAAAGLAVVVCRHERKSGGELGDSGRGSTAFAGAVDVLVHLRRCNTPGHNTRRELEAVSRFDDTPDKLVIELQDGRYVARGDSTDVERRDVRRRLFDVLPDSRGDALSFEQLRLALGPDTARTTLQRTVRDLEAQGLVTKDKGAGQSDGRAFGYWLKGES